MTDIAKQFELSVRGTHGEHSEAESGVYDISNKRRLGKTREALIRDMIKGVVALVKADS